MKFLVYANYGKNSVSTVAYNESQRNDYRLKSSLKNNKIVQY